MTSEVAASSSRCPFSHPREEFSPWQPDYVYDPYPSWKMFREEYPIFYSEEYDYWCVSRHDSIKQILLEPEKVSAYTFGDVVSPWPDDVTEQLKGVIPQRRLLSNLDGKAHDDARRFVRFAFTPRRLGWIRPHVEEIVDEQLDQLFANGDQADLVAEFCEVTPLKTLMRFLGLPDEMLPKVKKWSAARELVFQQKVDDEELRRNAPLVVDYYTYARERVLELEKNPGDDYMSELIQQWRKDQPENVIQDDLVNILITLLAAGHQTTADLSANGFRALLTHREQWDELCEDPSLVPDAVEELIRYDGSVPSWRRRVVEDFEVEGQTIPAGSRILMFLGSGNHDEDIVSDGEEFDIHRSDGGQYLTFGAGRHYCLGQSLAKLELNVMTERLTERYPNLQLVEGVEPTFRLNIIHRGPDSLPVELG